MRVSKRYAECEVEKLMAIARYARDRGDLKGARWAVREARRYNRIARGAK